MQTAIIIEDKLERAAQLKAELNSGDFSSVTVFSSVKEASHYLLKNAEEIDIIFLSLEIENNTGMNLFKQAPLSGEIVFISNQTDFLQVAYNQFNAPHIFHEGSQEQSFLALLKSYALKTNKADIARRLISHFDPDKNWFLALKKGKFVTIKLEDISFFQRFENSTQIKTYAGEVYTVNKPFEVVKHDFANSNFMVPHPDYLVRKNEFKTEQINGKTYLLLKMPSVRIPVINNHKILDTKQNENNNVKSKKN